MTGLRERNKRKRRTAILDAAVELLHERDFGAITIEQVAAHAEVSPHTIYNLVGTRDLLACALVDRVLDQMANSAPPVSARSDDPAAALRAVTDHCVDLLSSTPAAFRSVVLAASGHAAWPGDGTEPLGIFVRAARSLEEQGVLHPGVDARLVARHALFGLFGAVTMWARGSSDEQLRLDARTSLDLVLAGAATGAVAERARGAVAQPAEPRRHRRAAGAHS